MTAQGVRRDLANTEQVKILVVEDEPSIRGFLAQALGQEAFEVVLAGDGEEGLRLFEQESPDAVLLDLILPRRSGMEVLRAIRTRSETPVLVLSARDDETDIVSALEVGADDYLTKPYSTKELVARLRANLRKSRRSEPPGRIALGSLEVDWRRAELFKDGARLFLTAREFELLRSLHDNRDRVLTREWLQEFVWRDCESEGRAIDATIKRLRRKIGPDLIETVRGLGYRLVAEP